MAAGLQRIVLDWATAWGMRLDCGAAAVCARASSGVTATAFPIALHGEGGAWARRGLSTRIALELFAAEAAVGSIAQEVAQACERDAWFRLTKALHLDATDAQGTSQLPLTGLAWSGAVVATLPLEIGLLLTCEVAAGLLKNQGLARVPRPPRRGGLSPLQDALSGLPYRVEVQLHGCDIDIGAFKDLQVGDVLRIGHPLDQPALVRAADGAPLFTGHLARSRGRKAVELAGRGDTQSTARSMS